MADPPPPLLVFYFYGAVLACCMLVDLQMHDVVSPKKIKACSQVSTHDVVHGYLAEVW